MMVLKRNELARLFVNLVVKIFSDECSIVVKEVYMVVVVVERRQERRGWK